MTARYADRTKVTVEKSRAEIEKELVRFGASAFTSGFDDNRAFIMFRAQGRFVRLSLTLPTDMPPTRADAKAAAINAEKRRLWRSLLLLVKAKLAAVADGIVEFEQEFMPHIVMANSETVWERAKENIAHEYLSGAVTPLLGPPPKKGK